LDGIGPDLGSQWASQVGDFEPKQGEMAKNAKNKQLALAIMSSNVH
jgi:hypothetical protein